MGKRDKKAAKPRGADGSGATQSAHAIHQPHPPKKQPVILAISIVLFALWFVFLLVTALIG
jgi:hypothetical protein